MSKFLITTALPYANGPLHIGHLAGVYIPADIFVRFQRLNEADILFVGGSDEHGVPITIRAKNEGITPQQVVNRYHEQIKETMKSLGISFDNYSRTSLPLHHEMSQNLFKKLLDNNQFTEETTAQYYDVKNKCFLADRYIKGTCPKCRYQEAYGDQCEKCGTTLSPEELIDPKSMLSGEVPIKKDTTHWYLPLQNHEAWLKEWILETHKDDWKSNVLGQCKSWIDSGLKPRAMTRDLDWGVKVPVKGADGKVLYVWFDAPIGYISSTKEWTEKHGKNWEDYWKDPERKLVHFIGKDNIVFHCILFPAMLKALGDFNLPENVPANEFMNLEKNKVSTSKNWAVWGHEFLEEFPGKEDVLRYVLTANIPETKDSDFNWQDFQNRNNGELVAVFGNFVNRALVLIQKYYDGALPPLGTMIAIDKDTMALVSAQKEKLSHSLSKYKFREALADMMEIARVGNKYLADTAPWKLIKTDPERVKTILHLSIQIVANLSIACEPFLPFTAKKLCTLLNIDQLLWKDLGKQDIIKSGSMLNKPFLLFEKIEDEIVEAQRNKLVASQKTNTMNTIPFKENISFDDFLKMDLRVGKILEAEKVKKSNKLLQFKVDLGSETRTILSGIAKHYSPEEMVGKQVTVLANLAPRKIMGIESQGMILMAGEEIDEKEVLQLITPIKPIRPGAEIS